jgi:antitoxin (DNA-binding transcriptional repressor) of toxin-antitoxin stability system
MKKIELNTPAASEQAIREGQVEDVIVLEDGRPVALVMPFDEDDLAWYARERDPAFIESIAEARRQVAAGQTIRHDELNKRLGLQ